MSDLRDHSKPCEHGYLETHMLCPGGELVTDAVRLADADLEAMAMALAETTPTEDYPTTARRMLDAGWGREQ